MGLGALTFSSQGFLLVGSPFALFSMQTRQNSHRLVLQRAILLWPGWETCLLTSGMGMELEVVGLLDGFQLFVPLKHGDLYDTSYNHSRYQRMQVNLGNQLLSTSSVLCGMKHFTSFLNPSAVFQRQVVGLNVLILFDNGCFL